MWVLGWMCWKDEGVPDGFPLELKFSTMELHVARHWHPSSGGGSLSKPPNMERMQTLEIQWSLLGINKPQQEVITLSPQPSIAHFCIKSICFDGYVSWTSCHWIRARDVIPKKIHNETMAPQSGFPISHSSGNWATGQFRHTFKLNIIRNVPKWNIGVGFYLRSLGKATSNP